MCECNPKIRSPWCGVGDCQMPKQISNNGSFDLLAENLKLKQTNKQLFRALVNLVNLKIHKETFGKTEYYEQYKEFAWDDAKELIGGNK